MGSECSPADHFSHLVLCPDKRLAYFRTRGSRTSLACTPNASLDSSALTPSTATPTASRGLQTTSVPLLSTYGVRDQGSCAFKANKLLNHSPLPFGLPRIHTPQIIPWMKGKTSRIPLKRTLMSPRHQRWQLWLLVAYFLGGRASGSDAPISLGWLSHILLPQVNSFVCPLMGQLTEICFS